MRRPRILLADDHAIVADGLSRLLEPEFELAGKVQDGQALLEAAQTLKPEVIVADISMPLLNGLDAVRQLKKAGCEAKVIFLTMHSDLGFAIEAIKAGAAGYVLKQSAAEELLTAIRAVLKGGAYVTPLIANEVLQALMQGKQASDGPLLHLTPRERQVLQLVAEGNSAKEIATILKLSVRTAEFHKYNLMEKLNLHTTAELTRYAVKHGLVSP